MIRIGIFYFLTLSILLITFCKDWEEEDDWIHEEERYQLLSQIQELNDSIKTLKSSIVKQKTKLQIYSLYIFALICAAVLLFLIIIIIIIYEFIQNIKREKYKSILLQSKNNIKKSNEIDRSNNSKNSNNNGNNDNIINSNKSHNTNLSKNINIINGNINNINKNDRIEKEDNNNDDQADKPRTESIFSKLSDRSGYVAPCIGSTIKKKTWTNDGEEHNLNNEEIVDDNPFNK